MDPITAALTTIGKVCDLLGKVIDTVPPEQHDRNWARIERIMAAIETVIGDMRRELGVDDEEPSPDPFD